MALELRHVRYLAAVADTGGLSAAAASLHMSQPPLSRQMAELERLVGAQLLDRHGSGARLTPAGERFLTAARPALRALEAAVAAARSDEPMREVRVGYPENLGGQFVIDLAHAVQRELAGLTMTVRQSQRRQLLQQLRDGRLDLALLWAPPPRAGSFGIAEVGAWPLVVVSPAQHQLAALPTVEPDDLVGVPLIELHLEGAMDRRGRPMPGLTQSPLLTYGPQARSLAEAITTARAARYPFVAPATVRANLPPDLQAAEIHGTHVSLFMITRPGTSLPEALTHVIAHTASDYSRR